MARQLDSSELEKLRGLSSPSVSNALETFGTRLRHSGFTDATVRCIFPELAPTVGYAATLRVRTNEPPMEGDRYFYRLDWLDHLASIPEPRVLVVQDLDHLPRLGAYIGGVHANILRALKCIAVVTNGAVRDVDEVRALKLQLYAHSLSVSHSYAHVVEFGGLVEVGHMQVRPGDLVHGDQHGMLAIPFEIADQVAPVAERMIAEEREIARLCRSETFSVGALRAEVTALGARRHAFKS
jgi:regulator of RNase E activity RraA